MEDHSQGDPAVTGTTYQTEPDIVAMSHLQADMEGIDGIGAQGELDAAWTPPPSDNLGANDVVETVTPANLPSLDIEQLLVSCISCDTPKFANICSQIRCLQGVAKQAYEIFLIGAR